VGRVLQEHRGGPPSCTARPALGPAAPALASASAAACQRWLTKRAALLQSPEVAALKEEIAELKCSIKQFDPVSQFVQVSKAQRVMIKKEKALAALTGVRFRRCQPRPCPTASVS
jgi:hypothetical protein